MIDPDDDSTIEADGATMAEIQALMADARKKPPAPARLDEDATIQATGEDMQELRRLADRARTTYTSAADDDAVAGGAPVVGDLSDGGTIAAGSEEEELIQRLVREARDATTAAPAPRVALSTGDMLAESLPTPIGPSATTDGAEGQQVPYRAPADASPPMNPPAIVSAESRISIPPRTVMNQVPERQLTPLPEPRRVNPGPSTKDDSSVRWQPPVRMMMPTEFDAAPESSAGLWKVLAGILALALIVVVAVLVLGVFSNEQSDIPASDDAPVVRPAVEETDTGDGGKGGG